MVLYGLPARAFRGKESKEDVNSSDADADADVDDDNNDDDEECLLKCYVRVCIEEDLC